MPVCRNRGLHSLRLLPYYDALKAHLDVLEAMPHATFAKPPHLGTLAEGLEALEEACELKYGEKSLLRSTPPPGWDQHWRLKVRLGYERVSQTLWRVAREFDISGYGNVLREKLTTKWCDCGCSTDHLGEVCEKTVREDEENSGVRSGKQREWDGRGEVDPFLISWLTRRARYREWCSWMGDRRGRGHLGFGSRFYGERVRGRGKPGVDTTRDDHC